MASADSTPPPGGAQLPNCPTPPPQVLQNKPNRKARRKKRREGVNEELRCLFALMDGRDDELLDTLQSYHPPGTRGPKGYPVKALWRAYLACFYRNFDSTNSLIRALEDNPTFRAVCGFRYLPHRTTFNRFIIRLAQHLDLVEQVFAGITDSLKALLPGLGKVVAVDSTTVETYSNANRTVVSDPDARWGLHHKANAHTDQKEWVFGYKIHMVADVTYELPLAQLISSANRNDSPFLPRVFEQAEKLYDWFQPEVLTADRGYDSNKNHNWLDDRGVIPVIHIRAPSNSQFYDGVYTKDGVPVCLGMEPMKYVRTDPDSGCHLYRCQDGGCHLRHSGRGGIIYCDSHVWEDPSNNIRLFGKIRRQSSEWKRLYRKRYGIERVFKRLKQSRRLEDHCVRGKDRIALLCMMSTLVYQATALKAVVYGRFADMRWMRRKVA